MSDKTIIATGQKWRKGAGFWWRVVSIDSTAAIVGLSGPGIMRSYQTVSVEALERDWVLVP